MRLVPSEAAFSIVERQKRQNTVHVNTFKIKTKRFQLKLEVSENLGQKHFGTVRRSLFVSFKISKASQWGA